MQNIKYSVQTAEIISIGEELLIGQVINTNAAWMGEVLNEAGFQVSQISCIGDRADQIERTVKEAFQRTDIVLLTGGLGPTRDDITKNVLCDIFRTQLVMNTSILENIQLFFQKKGLPLTELNKAQALVPESGRVLENPLGTAPGLAFEQDQKLLVAMPGVPYEMQHIMTSFVIPLLKKRSEGKIIIHKTLLTQGIGESFLSDIIRDWEDGLGTHIKLAYLPSPGQVRLRLSMSGNDAQAIETALEKKISDLSHLIPQYLWGRDKDTFEELIGRLLTASKSTLSVAESCTGGYLAHRITSVAGSSAYFKGGVVAYDNQVKQNMLGVSSSVLQKHGAVSRETVEQMAMGVRERMGTDYAIATSGIAGPGGGTQNKPVGTVWIAVASLKGISSKHFLFGDNRERNIRRAGIAALALLREFLNQERAGQ